MSSVAAYNANDPYEQLIAQTIAIERQPQTELKKQHGSQNIFKGVLSDFDSALSALHTSLQELTDAFTNPFAARAASVPTGAGFSASASDAAVPGAHTLTVERLATADARVSRRFDAAGTDLRAFFDTYGAQTFEVDVFSPTDAEPDRRVAVAVSVEPTGATDAEVLAEIRAATGAALDAAVADGTIRREDAAAATLVNETSETARLTLRSGGTGFERRLGFTDSADGLLGFLEVSRDAVADPAGTSGGQITAVGTDDASSGLNAKLVLDGLTLYRSSNEVRDALEGLTLSLSSVGEPTAFSVGSDDEAVAAGVDGFIKTYNALLDFIARKTKVDAEAGTRSDFAGDASVRGLRYGMRTDLVQSVAGQPEGLARLTDLGIEVGEDGALELADPQALQSAAERDPDAVQRLFSAEEDGLGTRLTARLDAFLGNDGIVAQRRKSVDARIERLDQRIANWDTRLAQREDQLRLQYARFQETIALLQGQSDSVMTFLYGGF